MVKVCTRCGYENREDANYCGVCHEELVNVIPVDSLGLPMKKEKTWSMFDTISIVGFVIAIIGIFLYAVILLPIALIASVIGLKSKLLKGLAISGIVISVVAVVVKILVVLYRYDLIPYWITQGIF